MPASRTPEHDVAKRISVLIGLDVPGGLDDELYDFVGDLVVLEKHLHVGADLRQQTNEEAGKWIKAIIDRVVKKELGT